MTTKIASLVRLVIDDIRSSVLRSTLIQDEQRRLAASLQPLLSLEPGNRQSAVIAIIGRIIDEKQKNVLDTILRSIAEQANESSTSKQRATMMRMSSFVRRVIEEEHENVVNKVDWLLKRVSTEQRRSTVAQLGSAITDVIEQREFPINKHVRTRLQHMLRHELRTLLPRLSSAGQFKDNYQQAYVQLIENEHELVKQHMGNLVQEITEEEKKLIFKQLRPIIGRILLQEPYNVINKMAALVAHLIRDEQRVVKLRINMLRSGVVEQQQKVVTKLSQIVKDVIAEQESALLKMSTNIVDVVKAEEARVLSKLENASSLFSQQPSLADEGYQQARSVRE